MRQGKKSVKLEEKKNLCRTKKVSIKYFLKN